VDIVFFDCLTSLIYHVTAGKDTRLNGRRRRPGRKHKAQVYESICDENKIENSWFSENIETGK
jgi:hypothetical protein